MKLVIGVNHCVPFFVGGSERVVQQISESMNIDYGMECHIFCTFAHSDTIHNNIKIYKIKTAEEMLFKIKSLKPDHFHIYSDYFMPWPDILRKTESYDFDKSISLVGMNNMRSRLDLLSLFKQKHSKYKVVTHSSTYLDYERCKSLDIPVTVIPNSVDMKEFIDHGFSFKNKYKIETSKIILCVSNFYPGKGQEHLFNILNNLSKKIDDFTAVFICTTVNFKPAQAMRSKFIEMLKSASFKSKILIDIPREDTLQAFLESNVFVFPSQTEVAPLVILESMAAGLPWISMNVGNVSSLSGGIVIEGKGIIDGKVQYSLEVYDEFEKSILNILTDNFLRKRLTEEGKNNVLSSFNWEKTKKMYYKLFTGKDINETIS